MRHLPLREIGYALAFVAIFLVLYFTAYYAMVERITIVPGVTFNAGGIYVAGYRFGGDVSRVVFEPAHQLDRRYRRFYWNSH